MTVSAINRTTKDVARRLADQARQMAAFGFENVDTDQVKAWFVRWQLGAEPESIAERYCHAAFAEWPL